MKRARKLGLRRWLALAVVGVALASAGCAAMLVGAAGGVAGAAGYDYLKNR